jgi:hypothetical protein
MGTKEKKIDIDWDKAYQISEAKRQQKKLKDFYRWCIKLKNISADARGQLKAELTADIELQPIYWLEHGLETLKASFTKEDMGNETIMPIPVFLMGAEFFLKGMWLAQFEGLRALDWHSYISPEDRKSWRKKIQNEIGHNLLKIVDENLKIPEYKNDSRILKFLKFIKGLIKADFDCVYRSSKGENGWAPARYPVRFYNDVTRTAKAEILKSNYAKWYIVTPFEYIKPIIKKIWEQQH